MIDKDNQAAARALAALTEAFSMPRPDHFVRAPGHCPECAEHEETLSRVTPETISLKEVGSASWDPLNFVTDRAFAYFMPGLARLALGTGKEYYVGQLLSHLATPGRVEAFSAPQRKAVDSFLGHLYESMASEIELHDDQYALGWVFDQLSAGS